MTTTIPSVITCPECQGDGHTYLTVSRWDSREEQYYPEVRGAGPCQDCSGHGVVEATVCIACSLPLGECMCSDDVLDQYRRHAAA